MICPKCNTEYVEGCTKCSDCEEDLIDNDSIKQSDRGNYFFNFGETTAKEALSFLFYLGLLPLLFTSILFGKYLYLANTYLKEVWFIQDGQRMFTEKVVNNLPLGIMGGIIYFIVIVLVWKVICELLIIIFRAIETYTQKNKVQ